RPLQIRVQRLNTAVGIRCLCFFSFCNHRDLRSVGGRQRQICIRDTYNNEYDYEKLTESILGHLFLDGDDSIDFTAVNIYVSDPVSKALLKMGFEKKIGQVMMEKPL
ncbi:Histone acetyltransferase HPA2, partial [Cytobacillus firmus]